MELTLYTEGHFSAAHFLEDYEGKCAHIHGHTWKIAVWVRGDTRQKKANGILWDFGNIKKVIQALDHSSLNEILSLNPTAENITAYIYDYFKKGDPGLSFLVRVYENPVAPLSYCEAGDFSHA